MFVEEDKTAEEYTEHQLEGLVYPRAHMLDALISCVTSNLYFDYILQSDLIYFKIEETCAIQFTIICFISLNIWQDIDLKLLPLLRDQFQ